jgi:hypothetical protein
MRVGNVVQAVAQQRHRPDRATITAWVAAVTPNTAREIHSARIPSREVSIAWSTLSAES